MSTEEYFGEVCVKGDVSERCAIAGVVNELRETSNKPDHKKVRRDVWHCVSIAPQFFQSQMMASQCSIRK